MIIVRLTGGLGNQMFQYACGRAVSLHWNTCLMLDHSFLEDKSYRPDFTYRDYALNAFGIDKKVSVEDLTKLGFKKAYFSPLNAKLSWKSFLHGYKYYHEKGLHFKDEVFFLGPKLYLSGYFQSEKYFEKISNVIRDDFKFSPIQNGQNSLLLNKIQSYSNSVSLHIRRGDFLTAGKGTVHFTCTPEYYQKAISIIKSKMGNPYFFVFAQDDEDWARENIKFEDSYEFIGNNNYGSLSFEDLRLMSCCKNHIIANSSFSWWGAWLNPNPNKIIISPKNWLKKVPDIPDLIPNYWIKI